MAHWCGVRRKDWGHSQVGYGSRTVCPFQPFMGSEVKLTTAAGPKSADASYFLSTSLYGLIDQSN